MKSKTEKEKIAVEQFTSILNAGNPAIFGVLKLADDNIDLRFVSDVGILTKESIRSTMIEISEQLISALEEKGKLDVCTSTQIN